MRTQYIARFAYSWGLGLTEEEAICNALKGTSDPKPEQLTLVVVPADRWEISNFDGTISWSYPDDVTDEDKALCGSQEPEEEWTLWGADRALIMATKFLQMIDGLAGKDRILNSLEEAHLKLHDND